MAFDTRHRDKNGEISRKQPDSSIELASFNTPEGVTALEFYRKLILAPWQGKDGKTYHGVANRSQEKLVTLVFVTPKPHH